MQAFCCQVVKAECLYKQVKKGYQVRGQAAFGICLYIEDKQTNKQTNKQTRKTKGKVR